MQVIPDNLQITTGYHVFETPDDVIINSQIYDKFTMQPKDYCFWNTNYCLNNKNLLLHEVNILEYNHTVPFKEYNYNYYIQDSSDSSIFYFITEISSSNSNQYICKCKKTETSYEILNYISPDAGYRPPNGGTGVNTYLHYKLLGQTNEYLIIYQENSSCNNHRNQPMYNWDNVDENNIVFRSVSYIAINKSSFSIKTLTVANNLYDLGIFFIKEYNNYIYIMENIGGIINIIRYDPISNTRIILYTNDTFKGFNCIGISNIISFNDFYYILIGNENYNLIKIDINFDNNIVNTTIQNIDFIEYHNSTNRQDYLDCHWLRYSLKNIDDKYIAITSHDNLNLKHYYGYTRSYHLPNGQIVYFDQNKFSELGWHRHYLLKYNESTKFFEYLNNIEPEENNQHIYGVLYYDQYTPIFFMNNKIQIQRLNLETEQYEEVLEVPGTFYTVGLDSNNTLYLFDNNNKCTTYNTASSNQLEINFEKSQYKYNNQTINTYVTIYSKNLLNEYISSSVKITLSGNCQFTNGDKELYTNTDSNGPINIPVAITYGGKIYCYIEEV